MPAARGRQIPAGIVHVTGIDDCNQVAATNEPVISAGLGDGSAGALRLEVEIQGPVRRALRLDGREIVRGHVAHPSTASFSNSKYERSFSAIRRFSVSVLSSAR